MPPQSAPEPTKLEPTEERLKAALQTFFTAGTTMGTFFAGFAIVTLNIVATTDANKLPNARLYASISSLLFICLALLSAAWNVIFTYYQDKIVWCLRHGPSDMPDGQRTNWQLWRVFEYVPLFLFALLEAGLVFFLMIMKYYEKVVAIVGLSLLGLNAWVVLGGWLFLNPFGPDEPMFRFVPGAFGDPGLRL
jgi:hypothetical protein